MPAPKDEVVFSWDWLLLDKPSIEMLSYLLLIGGRFEGNTTSLCRLMGSQTVNSRLRNRRTATIQTLVECGAIQYTKKSATKFEINVATPKEGESVEIDRTLLEAIMRHEYTRSVAWEQVLRVYLWLKSQGTHIAFRRWEIGKSLGVGDDVITQACHVLDENYRVIALNQNRKQVKLPDGQIVSMCFGLLASMGGEFPSD